MQAVLLLIQGQMIMNQISFYKKFLFYLFNTKIFVNNFNDKITNTCIDNSHYNTMTNNIN